MNVYVDEKGALLFFVIYANPKDYPGKHVLRAWSARGGQGEPADWCIRCDTLEEIRLELPEGLTNVGRQPEDDPCIVEVWV